MQTPIYSVGPTGAHATYGHLPSSRSTILQDTIAVVAASAFSLLTANAVERTAPGLATLLRLVPIFSGLIWIFRRTIGVTSSGSYWHYFPVHTVRIPTYFSGFRPSMPRVWIPTNPFTWINPLPTNRGGSPVTRVSVRSGGPVTPISVRGGSPVTPGSVVHSAPFSTGRVTELPKGRRGNSPIRGGLGNFQSPVAGPRGISLGSFDSSGSSRFSSLSDKR